MKQKLLFALILLSTLFTTRLCAGEASLSVEDAWIAEAPPVSKVMVAYMTIKNSSDEAVYITKAESTLYSSIEFHETVHENGMARMLRYDGLNIPANSSIHLKRGGKHFMLFNPTKHLKSGDSVTIKLTTKSNLSKTVTLSVKRAEY